MARSISEMSPVEIKAWEEKVAKMLEKEAKQKDYNLRRRVRMNLMIEKAEKQGIKVTNKEIDDYLAKNPSTK